MHNRLSLMANMTIFVRLIGMQPNLVLAELDLLICCKLIIACSNMLPMYICKESKNISTKMLKDVGMTVPKSGETSAVDSYMQKEADLCENDDKHSSRF